MLGLQKGKKSGKSRIDDPFNSLAEKLKEDSILINSRVMMKKNRIKTEISMQGCCHLNEN